MLRAPILIAMTGMVSMTSIAVAGPGPSSQFQVNGVYFSGFDEPRGFGVFYNSAYQNDSGDNFPASSLLIQQNPDLEFDSYVAFGGQPSTRSSQAFDPPVTPSGFDRDNGFFDFPDSLQGAVLSSPGQPGVSEMNPASSRESFFFARISIPAGTTIGGSIDVDIVGEGVQNFGIDIFDPRNPRGDADDRGFREFRVIGQKTETNKELPIGLSPARGDTALFDVYDLYVELVPAPGAAVTLLGAGLLGATRRRR